MALKLKGSTSGFVGLDAPATAGNNTLILPENSGSAFQIFANDITAGVTTFTQVTVSRNGDLTVPGTISIGGTLTYEDVTSVDSVGVVTARGLSIFGNTTGLNVASGISTFLDISARNITGAAVTFSGVARAAQFKLLDNEKAKYGTGEDLEIYHNATNSLIQNGTGSLQIITTTGDLFFRGQDNITFNTAGNNERVRIDSAGRVMIGTTTEGFATYGDQFTIANSGHCGMSIRSGTSNYGTIYFSDGDDGSAAEVRGFLEYNHSTNALSLGSDGTARLRIDSVGDIFIGTNNDIAPSNGTNLCVSDGTVARLILEKQSTIKFGLNVSSGFTIYDETNDAARLSIDSGGNVTKPNSFHILVNRSGNQTGYNASNQSNPIIWNNVVSSQSSSGASSHFNTSTGLLTIPVTGLYWIHASVNANFNNEGAWIIVDGSRPATASTFYPNGTTSADGTIVYYLTANQTLGIKWYDNGNTNATINANNLHTFCRIVLLG